MQDELKDIKELAQGCLDNLNERHYFRSPNEANTIDNLKNIVIILDKLPKRLEQEKKEWKRDQEEYNSEFPAHLEGPEVFEIRDTGEQTIFDLEQEVREYRIQLGEKDVKIAQLNHKLKHTVAGGSIRWKLTYTWCDNVTEVYWDFKRKKDAVAHMEHIQNFFGIKVVESIRDIKYDKYIYGTRNMEKE